MRNGLKPTAYTRAARIERDGKDNVVIDLEAAVASPGGPLDVILEVGDRMLVPECQHTVQVTDEIVFPTVPVFAEVKDVDWYVRLAGMVIDRAMECRPWPRS